MSLLFYVGKRRQKPLRLQRYNKYLIYANKKCKLQKKRPQKCDRNAKYLPIAQTDGTTSAGLAERAGSRHL